MRLVKRPTLLLILSCALGLAACGGGDDEDDSDDGTTDGADGADDGADDGGIDPAGTDHTYVIDSVTVPSTPAQATEVGLNVDGEGSVDNALGGLLALLAGPPANLEIQATVDEQIAEGGIILLANVVATDLATASGVGLYVFLGDSPTPAPCADENDTECGLHLQGDGSFEISADSQTDAVVIGETAGGNFSGGPGEVTIELSLSALAEPLRITLIGAAIEAAVSADGLTGKLGGAITLDDVNNELIPGVAELIAGILEEEMCTGTAPPCCPDGSTGNSILEILDDNDDCVVPPEELAANSFISSTLGQADVTIDGQEAISLGIGFSAVAGTFTPP